jgi:hypothetical protein
MIILTRRTFQSATFSCYYSSVVENNDVQLLLFDCRREQRRSIIITRLSSRITTFNYYYSIIVESSDIEELRSTIVDDNHETERWIYQLMTRARKWYHQPRQSKFFLSAVFDFANVIHINLFSLFLIWIHYKMMKIYRVIINHDEWHFELKSFLN